MKFEYDPEKSKTNKDKHGLDFEEAQAIWLDPDRFEINARVQGEPRFLLLGSISGKVWAAVITYRKGAIRIISVRRARENEVKLYEEG